MRHLFALLGGLLLLISPATAWAAPTASPTDGHVGRVVELTNAERAKAGLAPLAEHAALSSAAQTYSEVLASSDCFAHTCGPVPNLVARGEQAGYIGWLFLGENIAGGQRSPEQVVAEWMASPDHRENILNPAFTEIGVGLATGTGRYGVYWAQAFGTRQ